MPTAALALDVHLIGDAEIPYELDLQREPQALAPWLQYLDFKATAPLHHRVFLYERACRALPRSYKLWKQYIDLRVAHLDGVNPARYEDEYVKVNECFERALMMLGKMPRLWIDYLTFLVRQCRVTDTRRTFDRALRTLPLSQHDRVWPIYLSFARSVGGPTAVAVYKRYIQFKPADIEDYISLLVSLDYYALAAQQYVMLLDTNPFFSKNGKSQFQIWTELTDMLVHQATNIRDYTARNSHRTRKAIDTEKIIRSGLEKFSDQRGKLWVNLATYKIALGDYEAARDVFEEGVTTVMTVRDFTLVFDAYAEFEESYIANLMERAAEDDDEVDIRMMKFEQLMDRRPFLLNDVLLRQNPNNVVEWEKRVGLWGTNQEQVVNTYAEAFTKINPKRATPAGSLYKLWVGFAKFYERADDLRQARMIFDRGVRVPFRAASELADLYIEWAEMELRAENFDRAVDIMAKATHGPTRSSVDFFDEKLTAQERLHKSMKLWSFYVDLVESVGTVDDTRKVYDRIFELKIATPLTVVNYANFLEENKYFEESFKIYERGVDHFSYPVAFELWNLYLTKAIKRKLNLERLRSLFEQALEKCPPEFARPLYILYGEVEETRGLARNAIQIYDRATSNVGPKDRADMYRFFIKKVAALHGLAATRVIYERALDTLPDNDCRELCLEFAAMEQKLGEVERARAVFDHGSQFADPRIHPRYWEKWHEFEVLNGTEETFKEMLRLKRSVQARYNTDINFIAVQTVAKKTDESNAAAAPNAVEV
ncbi:uncharacterized protein V1518DRAFT_419595 [Limtongia smithiae]|uniref:uncharacterized protein n=1 Tax=Limtongia smithiae TaxID=1125753 RepID=UPI0034CD0E9C